MLVCFSQFLFFYQLEIIKTGLVRNSDDFYRFIIGDTVLIIINFCDIMQNIYVHNTHIFSL